MSFEPEKFFESYIILFTKDPFAMNGVSSIIRGFFNSLWQSLVPSVIGLVISGLSAYFLSIVKFPGSKIIYAATIGTMMIPLGAFGMVSYMFYQNIGWVGTVLPIIIPGLFGSAGQVFFLSMFYTMIDDVKANDLVSPDGTPSRSYDDLTSLIDGFDQYKQNMAIIASSVSFSIACIIIYFVYPQVNKTGRTPSQSMLRVDRVDKSSFTIMKRWVRVLIGIYQSVFLIPMLLFLPIPTVSVNYVFSIAPLFGLFITGAVLLIADMIVVLADKYNRGMTELFTHSVCLKEESLDEIYKAKGHYI